MILKNFKIKKEDIRFFIISVTLMFNIIVAHSQQTKITRDILFWPSIGIEKEVFNNFNAGIEKEVRLYKNFTLIEEQFTEIKLSYNLPRNLEVGAGVRWIIENQSNDRIERKYRYDFKISYMYKFTKFHLKYRFKFQNKNEDFFKFDVPYKNILSYRNRIEIKSASIIFSSKPYFSTELFLKDEEYVNIYFNKLRFIIGTRYSINKKNRINLYYQIERELGSIMPYIYYCIGVKYKFELD